LGLGVTSPSEIQLVASDEKSRELGSRITEILQEG